MRTNWHGLIKVIEAQHISKDGNILWEEKNLYNMFHQQGEQFALGVLFSGTALPSFYYFGLDNRASLLFSDTMSTVAAVEPATNMGYARVADTADAFSLSLVSSVYMATSPIVEFRCTLNQYTIKNMFLTTQSDQSGALISSVVMNSSGITITSGETIRLKMAMTLRDCPSS